ncbi:uncharacterized protein LOC141760402 isoform X3 [Sebastes fasciatus]|uniref:uncharacterized protein LOC141760402 isoform X3 n=1 Tax=Sebastes fasciatus TaxID=394691 RepID=UPI003D9F4C28
MEEDQQNTDQRSNKVPRRPAAGSSSDTTDVQVSKDCSIPLTRVRISSAMLAAMDAGGCTAAVPKGQKKRQVEQKAAASKKRPAEQQVLKECSIPLRRVRISSAMLAAMDAVGSTVAVLKGQKKHHVEWKAAASKRRLSERQVCLCF